MTNKELCRTAVVLVGAIVVGMTVALDTDAARAQCGYGFPYYVAPYEPPLPYWYRMSVPSYGCYPAYRPRAYVYHYVVPQVTPVPAPRSNIAGQGREPHQAPLAGQSPAVPDTVPPLPSDVQSLPAATSQPASPANSDSFVAPGSQPTASANAQTLAENQRICPVTGQPLGSMGEPHKIRVHGRDVLLCCRGCEAQFMSDPDKYLAKLKP